MKHSDLVQQTEIFQFKSIQPETKYFVLICITETFGFQPKVLGFLMRSLNFPGRILDIYSVFVKFLHMYLFQLVLFINNCIHFICELFSNRYRESS